MLNYIYIKNLSLIDNIFQVDIIDERDKVLKISRSSSLSQQAVDTVVKIPGRLIQFAHMVSSFNTFLYEESQFIGHPVDRTLSQNWIQLSNTKDSDFFLEEARPRIMENQVSTFHGTEYPSFPAFECRKMF